MKFLTLDRLLLYLFVVVLIVLLLTGCGLGIRIEPDGMTFQWDWPDNVSAVIPQNNSTRSSPPSTRSPPPG